MGKVFGMLVLATALWVGLEVFNEGVDGAFDGAFSGGKTPVAERESTARRAGSSVESAHAAGEDRRARLLGE